MGWWTHCVDASLLAGATTAPPPPAVQRSGCSCWTLWRLCFAWQWVTTAATRRWKASSIHQLINLSVPVCYINLRWTFRNMSNLSISPQVLTGLSGVDSSHAEVVLGVLRSRQLEIRRALLLRTDSISSSTLDDFDWQLKVSQWWFNVSLLLCIVAHTSLFNVIVINNMWNCGILHKQTSD